MVLCRRTQGNEVEEMVVMAGMGAMVEKEGYTRYTLHIVDRPVMACCRLDRVRMHYRRHWQGHLGQNSRHPLHLQLKMQILRRIECGRLDCC